MEGGFSTHLHMRTVSIKHSAFYRHRIGMLHRDIYHAQSKTKWLLISGFCGNLTLVRRKPERPI